LIETIKNKSVEHLISILLIIISDNKI